MAPKTLFRIMTTSFLLSRCMRVSMSLVQVPPSGLSGRVISTPVTGIRQPAGYVNVNVIRCTTTTTNTHSLMTLNTFSRNNHTPGDNPTTPSTDLSSYTVIQLRQMLKDRGIKVSGKKNDLITRLSSSVTAAGRIAAPVPPSAGATKHTKRKPVASNRTAGRDAKRNSSSKQQQQQQVSREGTTQQQSADAQSTPTLNRSQRRALKFESSNASNSGNARPTNDGLTAAAAVTKTTQAKKSQPNESQPAPPTNAAARNAKRTTRTITTDAATSNDTVQNSRGNDKRNTERNNVNAFEQLTVPQNLIERLNRMNITEPTPIQTKAIPIAMRGTDVMGLAQTGTGKTLAFGLPLVARMLVQHKDEMRERRSNQGTAGKKTIKGLVLAPTRELANQIAVQLEKLTEDTPLQTFVVVGGKNIQTQINQLRSGPGKDLLVATPGRLLDLMDRGAVNLNHASFLVLDEADMMLDMGFLRDLKKIAVQLPNKSKRQTMCFSATMNKDMNVVASDYLQNPVRVEVARAGQTADKIAQELHYVSKPDKPAKLLQLLQATDQFSRGQEDDINRSIVFGRTKHGMEKLSKKLIAAGIKAVSIHGNKSQPARDKALAAFKTGEIRVLVATDVAARGLDIPDVKQVYNYELPNVPEAYVHRIGRTARAGKEGKAIAFCSMEEMEDLRDIQKVIKISIPVVSGTPWGKEESRREMESIKERKMENELARRNAKKNKKPKQSNTGKAVGKKFNNKSRK